MKIQQVDLWVSNLEEIVIFYRDILEFPLKLWKDTEATFQIGNSNLRIIKDSEARKNFYHFAFNIHANMFSKAKQWLQERVILSTEDGEDEVEYSGHFKAKSCYFQDPAGNIVEFIAREAIAPKSNAANFSSNNVIEISEIGLTTHNIIEFADKIMELGIPSQDGVIVDEPEHLNFMGDPEEGVYILLGPVGRRWLFSDKRAIASPVKIYTDKGIISNVL